MGGVRIVSTARKHGIADADVPHALRHPLRDYPDQGTHKLTLVIGPARDGSILEVGIVEDEVETRVVHAMPARPRYWP